jgi:hypothetical protein
MRGAMLSRRGVLGLLWVAPAVAACEALGIHGKIVTTMTQNGHTTVHEHDFKNWNEFKEAMGETATDFSDFAKEVGAVTAELVKKLVDVPPPGHVRLGDLDPALKPFEGDVRYDYLKVATMQPNPAYDLSYVQIGMNDYDAFFKASAQMYATAYQLMETGRHIVLAKAAAANQPPDSGVNDGTKHVPKGDVESALSDLKSSSNSDVAKSAERLATLYGSVVTLGAGLASKTAETVQTGLALVAGAPKQILNPKLVLHLGLIVKGLSESVGLVKDTGGLLGRLT